MLILPLRSHYSPLIALAAGKWKNTRLKKKKKQGAGLTSCPQPLSSSTLTHITASNHLAWHVSGSRDAAGKGCLELTDWERETEICPCECTGSFVKQQKSSVFGMLSNPSAISQLVYAQSLCCLHIASPASLPRCSINIHASYTMGFQNQWAEIQKSHIFHTVEVKSWIKSN